MPMFQHYALSSYALTCALRLELEMRLERFGQGQAGL